jgi:hypothetical protein
VPGPDPLGQTVRSDHSSESALSAGEVPALRDAHTIARRIADDELQADEARRRYQIEGLPTLQPNARLAALRRPDETAHAAHTSAMLELSTATADGPRLQGGTLYLTSRRLLHTGAELTEVPLSSIAEMAVALERLLLIRLSDGSDLALEVDRPRLLRVQIAAAKGAARATEQ